MARLLSFPSLTPMQRYTLPADPYSLLQAQQAIGFLLALSGVKSPGPLMRWETDRESMVIAVDAKWLEFRGCKPEDALGFEWANALHPDDVERVVDAWLNAFTTRTAYLAEARVRHNDGTYRRVRAFGIPRPGETFTGYVGIIVELPE